METGNDNSEKKTGWLLLKIWFGVLFGSGLCNCVIVGIMIMILPKMSMHDSYTPLMILLYLFMILALALGALTLFLNCSRRIRENGVARFLSFFLLPLLMVAHQVVERMPDLEWREIRSICPPILAFLPCLTVGYILFVRRLKKNSDNYQKHTSMNHSSKARIAYECSIMGVRWAQLSRRYVGHQHHRVDGYAFPMLHRRVRHGGRWASGGGGMLYLTVAIIVSYVWKNKSV